LHNESHYQCLETTNNQFPLGSSYFIARNNIWDGGYDWTLTLILGMGICICTWWWWCWASPSCWRFKLLKKLCFWHAPSKPMVYLSFTHLMCYTKILELDFGFWYIGYMNLEFWIYDFGLKKFALNNGNVFDQCWIGGFLRFELLISFCNSLHIFIFVIIWMFRIISKFLYT